MSMIQQEHLEKISLQKLKIRMSASPGRRHLRLRLSKRLIGKLCSGLRNILQSAEIRIDYGIFSELSGNFVRKSEKQKMKMEKENEYDTTRTF